MKTSTITGKIVHGDKIGRTVGFPTANFDVSPAEDELDKGVYLCQANLDNKKYFGLAYFGPRTINGELHNSFEVYFYDFGGDLYGQQISATVIEFMRPPVKLNSLAELKTALEKDKVDGLQRIAKLK